MSDDLENFKSIVHSSTYSILETKRPGTHRRVANTTYLIAVHSYDLCLRAVQQIFSHSKYSITNSVEMAGFEPATFALQRRCSPTELHPQDLPWVSGLDRIRTCDPCVISTVL